MKMKILVGFILLGGFIFLLPEPIEKVRKRNIENTNTNLVSNNFIIRNVRVYTGDKLLNSTDIIVKNNRIYKIGTHLKVSNEINSSSFSEIDGKGKTLLPGFIDSHTHAYQNALTDAINFGVTTELDMFTMPAFANQHQNKRDNVDNTNEADLFSSTILATTKNGHGTEYGFKIPVLENTSEVEAFVKDRISEGADYIKAVYNAKEAKRQHFPSISYEVLEALINQTHKQGKILVVHVDNLISARHAIELGANGIVHSFMDQVVDDEFVSLMLKNNSFIIPTLSVNASLAQLSNTELLLNTNSIKKYLSRVQKTQLKAKFPNFGIPKEALDIAFKSVKKLSDSGVTILAGSDAPNPGTTHGVSLHGELQLLVQAGLTNEQAIYAATGAAGNFFKIGDRGTIKVGSLATMIMIDGNPFDEIEESTKIQHIWKNGHLFERKFLTDSKTALAITPHLISDFDTATNTNKPINGILKTTDEFAGGNSTASMELLKKAPDDQFLQIQGELKKGFMFPWSGISYLPTKSMNQGADFSLIKSISFTAKTNSETISKAKSKNLILSVLVFQQGSFQPFEQTIELTRHWQDYDVKLKSFGPLDLSNIVNISIVNNKLFGEFDFSIDNLRLN